jgi:hypothetical protein
LHEAKDCDYETRDKLVQLLMPFALPWIGSDEMGATYQGKKVVWAIAPQDYDMVERLDPKEGAFASHYNNWASDDNDLAVTAGGNEWFQVTPSNIDKIQSIYQKQIDALQ